MGHLFPDPFGGYWLRSGCDADGAHPECLPYSWSFFHFTPPDQLRLDVPWVDLALALESSDAYVYGLAVSEAGEAWFLHHEDPDPLHRTGLYHAPVGGAPTFVASEHDLWTRLEDEFSWHGLRAPLLLPDGAVLVIADRRQFLFDMHDVVIRIEPDGAAQIVGDGRLLPEGEEQPPLSGLFVDLALSPEGNLVVADYVGVFEVLPDGGDPLVRIDRQGLQELVGRVGPHGEAPWLSTLAVAADGTILVWERVTETLVRLPPDGPPEALPMADSLDELNPDYIGYAAGAAFVDAAGRFVAGINPEIVAITPDGEASLAVDRDTLLGATERLTLATTALARGPGGAIVVFDRYSNRLLRVCPQR